MPLDPSIALQYKPFEVPSQTNALARILQLQGAQQQNALGGLQLQEQQNTINERNALRDYLGNTANNIDTPEGQAGLYKAAPTQAAGILKGRLDLKSTQSTIDKNNADALAKNAETAHKAVVQTLQTMPAQYDPQAISAWYQEALANKVPGVTMQTAQADMARIPQDPAGYAQWRTQQQMRGTELAKQIEMALPKLQAVSLGGSTQMVDTNPMTRPANAPTSLAHTVSPDAVLSARTSTANTAATNETHLKVAGLNPDGSATGDTQAMVDAIGQYKVAPPNGMALRNPRMQSILAQVAQKYPDFDATQYGARQQAAKSFSTGKDGQAVQSANTAVNHLETLRELAAAQANGNIPLFNQVANEWAKQTGQAAPTNLQAAVTMVGPEISKAVVGAGGGVDDRKKVDGALASLTKGAPAQAAGTIGTMLDLFGGRLTEAQRTYERTTGRKDFADTLLSPAAAKVLAARTPAAAGAHPAEIADLLNKYGRK